MNVPFEITFKSWNRRRVPKRILAIRLQALGDTVVTLPYLQSLKKTYPGLEIHFLTRQEVSPIPKNITLFEKVIAIKGGRNSTLQFFFALLKLPYLWCQRYDIVLDLQKNNISIPIRKLLLPKAWAEFDKFSNHSAGERTKKTIEALGLWKVCLETKFKINIGVDELLLKNGWTKNVSLVLLNPASAFPSRNWPVDNYIAFAKLWLERINPKTQFVLLLLPSKKLVADQIVTALGDKCINLTGLANQAEAFAVIQKCMFVLSEDGGLMHMSWVQGIPTLALFSSSKKVWSAPQGDWSLCLDSSDMECGPCDFFICKYGDNRCLTRYSPAYVLEKATRLLLNQKNIQTC